MAPDYSQVAWNSDPSISFVRPSLQVVLFEEEGFKCQSRYNNQIAFSVDIALLLKVLRAAVGHDADALEMKLAMRSVPCTGGERGDLVRHTQQRLLASWCPFSLSLPTGVLSPVAAGGPTQQRPTLAFSWRGHNVTMVQELPIRWVAAGGMWSATQCGPSFC